MNDTESKRLCTMYSLIAEMFALMTCIDGMKASDESSKYKYSRDQYFAKESELLKISEKLKAL